MPLNNQNGAGSELVHEPAFLVLGKLRRAHGVLGEIAMEVHTRMLELLDPGSIVFVGEEHQPFTIEKTRWKQELLLLKFKGFDDRTSVSALTNALLYVREDDLPELLDDETYFHDLIGMDVFATNGDYIGIMEEILETGANDVFLVRDEAGNEVLIPAVEAYILEINLDEGKMIVSPIEWFGGGD
jgi:16S rRNA processing protein RimM